jgi:hypothetical protein
MSRWQQQQQQHPTTPQTTIMVVESQRGGPLPIRMPLLHNNTRLNETKQSTRFNILHVIRNNVLDYIGYIHNIVLQK